MVSATSQKHHVSIRCGYLWFIMGAGEQQQEVVLDNPVNALSQKVATDMKVAKGSAELIAVNLL